jgi:hypothetical protein
MRQEALYGHGPMYNGTTGSKEGSLPIFADRDGEIIPLTQLQNEDDYYKDHDVRSDHGSHVSGVGQGYGRRTDGPPNERSNSNFSNSTGPGRAGLGAGSALAAGGAGALLAHRARDERGYPQQQDHLPPTVEPFTGMTPNRNSEADLQQQQLGGGGLQPMMHNGGQYQSQYPSLGYITPPSGVTPQGPSSPTRYGGYSTPNSYGRGPTSPTHSYSSMPIPPPVPPPPQSPPYAAGMSGSGLGVPVIIGPNGYPVEKNQRNNQYGEPASSADYYNQAPPDQGRNVASPPPTLRSLPSTSAPSYYTHAQEEQSRLRTPAPGDQQRNSASTYGEGAIIDGYGAPAHDQTIAYHAPEPNNYGHGGTQWQPQQYDQPQYDQPQYDQPSYDQRRY